jgi:GNAT superfamily N-acetyltransferase
VSRITVRPFRRADRVQLTELVNTHVGAVVPGWTVSPNAVLSQLERQPEEAVVDPWVAERTALVAVERDAVVAAAYIKRYRADDDVAPPMANAGSIDWLMFWPRHGEAADALMAECQAQLDRWGVATRYADGALPTPATYGVPDCWPHIAGLYRGAGFVPVGPVEVVLVARVEDLPTRHEPPVDGLTVRREVGYQATRFAARRDGEVVGYTHVRADMTAGGTLGRLAGWADMWELSVEEPWRRRGVATWLLGEVAGWLRLAGSQRLIDQAWPHETDRLGFLTARGFAELTRTRRGWEWQPHPTGPRRSTPG